MNTSMGNNMMDHSMMDHSMHSKMGMGHDMPGMKMCKMSMTLNADYENLCILTDHIMVTSRFQLVLAMVGVGIFAFGYEYFKIFVDQLESRYAQFLQSNTVTECERKAYKLRLSSAYAFSVGYSFIIMLLFMSFNIWVMFAVCVGAGLGHYFCDRPTSSTANLACH